MGHTTVCHWCKESLTFVIGKGWVHPEGGLYAMRCPDCGWTGAPYPSPRECPRCGGNNMRDDHCAMPVG